MTSRDPLAHESRRSAPARSGKPSAAELAAIVAAAESASTRLKGKTTPTRGSQPAPKQTAQPAPKPQQTKPSAPKAASQAPRTRPQPQQPVKKSVRPVILTNEQKAAKKAPQKSRRTKRRVWTSAAIAAMFGAAAAYFAVTAPKDDSAAVVTAAERNITIIHEVPKAILKDQARILPESNVDGITQRKVFAIIANPATGKSCFATEGKTEDQCRAEVGLPLAKKLLPLPVIDPEAERTRLATLEADKIEKARLAAIEADRAEQRRMAAIAAKAKAEAEALALRPTRVAFADALQPESMFPVKGLRIPNGRTITLKDRYAMSAATLKAEDLHLNSVLAWHQGKPITVETALRHMNIWRLPKPEDMNAFKGCLEKYGFQSIPLADLKHIEKQYGLPAGIMARIYANESGGYQCTESWTNARGPLQVMHITQKHMMDEYGLGRGNMYELAEAAHITGNWLRHYKNTYNIGRFSHSKQIDILMAFYVQGPRDVVPNIKKDGTLVVENLTCDAKGYIPGSKQRCGQKGTPTAIADASGPNLFEAIGNLFSAPKGKRTENRSIMSLQPGN